MFGFKYDLAPVRRKAIKMYFICMYYKMQIKYILCDVIYNVPEEIY